MFESSYGEGVSAETWEFRLSQEPARLWSALADTNRLFEALDYPRYVATDEIDPESGARRRIARSGQGARGVEWIERPFEWATGQWWRMERRYLKGPLARLEATLYLRRSAGGGSIAQYSLTAEASGVLGRTLLSSGHLRRLGEAFLRRAEEADDFLAGRANRLFSLKPPSLTRETLSEIDSRAASISALEAAQSDPIFDALVELLKTGSESEIAEIRPRALAKRLDRPAVAAIEACLAAAELGLLRRRFTPISPESRRPAVGADSLAGLEASALCLTDGRRFAVDLAQNVELSFRAASDLRAAGAGGYCLAGPLRAPHIVLQQELEPGERRALPFHPPSGGYRFRVEDETGARPGGHGPWSASVEFGGGPTPTLLALDDGVAIGGAPPDQALVLENHASRHLRFIVEVRAWRGDAASAASVVLTEAHRRAFPLDAPSAPLPAGRMYAAAFMASAALPMREALGAGEAARRFSALLKQAAELARAEGGLLLRRGAEAGVALFTSAPSAAAFAVALREGGRAILAGAPPEVGVARRAEEGWAADAVQAAEAFAPGHGPAALGLAIGIDEGAIVLLDTGSGADAAGDGVTRAETMAAAAGRDGLIICAEVAAAPDAAGLWTGATEEVEISAGPDDAPFTAVRVF